MTVRNDRESAEFTLLSTYFLFSGQIIYTDEKLPPDVPTHNILQHCVNLSQGRCPAPDWKRPPGRPRKTWIQQVDHWCTIDSLWSSAQDRSLWRSLRPSLVRRSSEWVSEAKMEKEPGWRQLYIHTLLQITCQTCIMKNTDNKLQIKTIHRLTNERLKFSGLHWGDV